MHKLLLSATLFASSAAFASTWDIDSAHAAANFAVKHMMVSTVNGTLGEVKGTVELDDKDVTKSTVNVTIDVAGLNTKVQKRDDHLRSGDFFDAAKFPAITFKSTKIAKAGKKLKVTGDLQIKDVTKSVTFDVELTDEVANPFTKSATRGVTGGLTINREDWGLRWNMPMANNGVVVAKDVKISIDAELVKREAPAAEPAKK